MPAYVIADVRDAWDAEALDEYRRRNTDAVANHGGSFVVRGGEHEVLEGEWDTRRIVVIAFPDMAAARAWWALGRVRGDQGAAARRLEDEHRARRRRSARRVAPRACALGATAAPA